MTGKKSQCPLGAIRCDQRAWRRAGTCWLGLALTVLLLVQGCAVRPPSESPGTPPRPLPTPPVEQAEPPVAAPVPPAGRESVPGAQEGKAAGTLLAGARQNMQAGRYSQAEMALERALRLEPRNARLWHEMAQVKFAQRDYRQSVQFCLKSNSLAGRDHELIRHNWQLMEKAYLELGEPDKARQAHGKAG
ncbi:MAG: hypothetical protein BWK76_11945 [Desulfobulbaceae bacterium A2]|nr:MAG: hypothetical protein BWK76_11945 [Desulfobulbaceae bacterium A2]